MYKLVLMLSCAVLLLALFPMSASADQWNKKTIVTFSESVELPGVVLPPGTYVFKLFDSMSNRNIVQVFNEDETHIYATILAIPDYRLEPTDKTVLRFEERPVNKPEAVRAWFYPGDNFGQEFVYPKARAIELAEETHHPVPTAEVKPMEKPEELMKEPIMAVTPERKEVEVSEAIEVTPPETPAPVAVAPVTPAPELPKTASPLPLIALFGVASLGLAGLLKVISKLRA